MTAVLNYFGGFNGPKTAPTTTITTPTKLDTTSDKPRPVRALPAPWYTSSEMYHLERRAIFSRRWLFMTHKSRLQNPGDFLRYDVAGFDLVINMDKDRNIRAFHNACRHRGYQVVEEECGQKKIFSCRYHGWSYGLNGKLAKAPAYQELEGFDKNKNGLFPIHTHIDSKGFVWINLDGKETPEISWEEQFKDVDNQERFDQFDFDDYVLDHVYTQDGNYNWKILSDNFNECYHCATTHPDVPQFLTIDSHSVETAYGHMQHDHASTPEQKAKGYNVNSTYYFPNASMSVAYVNFPSEVWNMSSDIASNSPHFLMIQKFLPKSATQSSMHYEVYRNKHSSDEDFHLIADTYARVMAEDKVLCDGAQRNIEAGVFVNGNMHPRWEKGPLYFQQSVREVVTEHYRKEKAAGEEIWPARQNVDDAEDAEITKEDLEICKGVECMSGEKDVLAW